MGDLSKGVAKAPEKHIQKIEKNEAGRGERMSIGGD
jgi:hypothetical protein